MVGREKLRRRVRGRYATIEDFAKDMGYTRQTISCLLGSADMTLSQVLKFCDVLEIKRKEIPDYFFPPDVVISKRHCYKAQTEE